MSNKKKVATPSSVATESNGFDSIQEESKMVEVLPARADDKMSKTLKPKLKSHPYTLDNNDLQDFRIPIKIFKEYSIIMKGLNKECKNSFLNAMGVDISYKNSKIDWEKFISLNCLLKFNTASLEEYINFFEKVFDPFNRGLVPAEQFNKTLKDLFKGQF